MISRRRAAGRFMGMTRSDDLTIRLSRADDALALGRLAQLDGTLHDGSPALVAEVAGELVAALPLEGRAAFADPFRRTAELVDLLGLRREQVAAAAAGGGAISRARRAGRRLRRYRAPASA